MKETNDMIILRKETDMKGKKLSEMTLEELWHLFPIQLTEHNEIWSAYYDEIKHTLEDILAGYQNIRISHIGSTAIRGIWAKPIVDVLAELDKGEEVNEAADFLSQNGFILMHKESNRISLNCGYTEEGFADKVYHIHLRCKGDNDELYFRDYLNEFPERAKLYEQLKLSLWKQYEFDRDGYTAAKTELVSRYTKEAKERYKGRYSER